MTQNSGMAEAVQVAAQQVERARVVLAEWSAREAAAQAELQSLRDRAGGEVLDNPDAEGSLIDSIRDLEAQVDMARRAVAAQQPRVLLAERHYLTAEADRLEEPLVDLERKIAAHEAKTKRLLGQLEEHEGRFVPEIDYIELLRAAEFQNAPKSWQLPNSALMRTEVETKRRQVLVLRAMVAGEDLDRLAFEWGVPLAEVMPPCVYGPEALVPAAAYVRSVQRARAVVAELEGLQRRLPAEVQGWQRKQDQARPGENLLELEHSKARLRDVPGELAQARAALADLTAS